MMPSLDFKRIWHSGTQTASAAAAAGGPTAGRISRGARLLSIWRPVGPPGYAALGDVAMPGNEPPSGRPVKMYKDVVGAGATPGQVRRKASGAQKEGVRVSGPGFPCGAQTYLQVVP